MVDLSVKEGKSVWQSLFRSQQPWEPIQKSHRLSKEHHQMRKRTIKNKHIIIGDMQGRAIRADRRSGHQAGVKRDREKDKGHLRWHFVHCRPWPGKERGILRETWVSITLSSCSHGPPGGKLRAECYLMWLLSFQSQHLLAELYLYRKHNGESNFLFEYNMCWIYSPWLWV